jgi:hypothetical protein
LKGDGSLLTATDRDANCLADRFAKAAAAEHTVDEPIRAAIQKQQKAVVDMATWIAYATGAANHFQFAGGCLCDWGLASQRPPWEKQASPNKNSNVSKVVPLLTEVADSTRDQGQKQTVEKSFTEARVSEPGNTLYRS